MIQPNEALQHFKGIHRQHEACNCVRFCNSSKALIFQHSLKIKERIQTGQSHKRNRSSCVPIRPNQSFWIRWITNGLLSKILGGSETCIHCKDSSLHPFRYSNSLAENQLNRMTQSRVGRPKLERSLIDWQILMTVKGVWKRGRLWSGTGFVAKSTTGTKKVGGCINFKHCSRKVASLLA